MLLLTDCEKERVLESGNIPIGTGAGSVLWMVDSLDSRPVNCSGRWSEQTMVIMLLLEMAIYNLRRRRPSIGCFGPAR